MTCISDLAFDAGGTFLKYGTVNSLNSLPLPYTRDFLSSIIAEDVEKIFLTGAGAKTIYNWFKENEKVTLTIHNEFTATGLGGAFLSGLDECLVINIGSGTPILYVNYANGQVRHLGGTGLGSASLVGLSHFILQINDLNKISELALQGNPKEVNLLVGDLYPKSMEDLGLPADITASNFGKYQDWRQAKKKPSKDDILAGLHVLVAETIAVIANQASKAYDHNLPIVITGGGTLNKALVKYLKKTFQYLNKTVIIPEKAMYGTLLGLFEIEKRNS